MSANIDQMKRIQHELERACEKHPNWPSDLIHAWAIVQEEAGETQKEVLQLQYETDSIYIFEKLQKIRIEAVQTAAMCVRFLAHLELDHIDSKP